MMPAWVRRIMGPTRAELRESVRVWQERCAKQERTRREADQRAREWRRAAGIQKNRAETLEAQLRRAQQEIKLKCEPEQREGCVKVRLHGRDEAEAWAQRILASTGGEEGELCVYSCKVCPRSPVTGQRYWHAGHNNPDVRQEAIIRQQRNRAAARREGLTIGQRVDPRVLERLQLMKGERA